MCRRGMSLLLSAVLVLGFMRGVPAQAHALVPAANPSVHIIKAKSIKTAPLVPAMFLVLAGVSISMLFDKRD